jgi:hypothetical protein
VTRSLPNTAHLCAALLAACLSAAPGRLLAQDATPTAVPAPVAAVSPPADPPPAAAPPASEQDLPVVEVIEPRLELTLRAPHDVALFTTRQIEGATAERQCAGDCTVSLAPGRYRFALAERKRAAVAVRGSFRLEGSDVLEARYVSARNKRIAGSLLLALVFPASSTGFVGSLKALAGLDEICDLTGDCRSEKASASLKANLVLSSVTLVASGVLGSWLVSRRDRAEVRLRGLSAGNRRESEVAPAEPIAQVEPLSAEPAAPRVLPELPPTPAEVRGDDLARIAAHRAELAQCFPITAAKSVLLDIDIDVAGGVVRVVPSRPLSQRVQSCLQRSLVRIAFLATGTPRTVRMLLSP